ncbi:methyltransferase domain-containing protein [Amycolatopsis sp. NPDC051071]|uniref:class I SAM-dependent methyltransferase n=1 Tax=Amycolatopsis sp. NPDC051071 TaxID=3154637 RepID=UPI003437D436
MRDGDHSRFAGVPFLPGITLREYLDELRLKHPNLYGRLDLPRLQPAELVSIYRSLDSEPSAFADADHGGRGDAYRAAQTTYPLIRSRGIELLCRMATPVNRSAGAVHLLDALGGNGTMTRALRLLRGAAAPTVFTADIAAPMIIDALDLGLPAVRQSTQRWLFRDSSLDGVVFAYGTHHIPTDEQPQALAETRRVLRPGGRVVVHDFEEGTPTALWYSEALDRYTETGHKHDHFTPGELRDLLTRAGFRDIEVHHMYDPCVVYADSATEASHRILDYMYSLFAIHKLFPRNITRGADFWSAVEELVRRYATFTRTQQTEFGLPVRGLTVTAQGSRFRAELPRVALVGTATR